MCATLTTIGVLLWNTMAWAEPAVDVYPVSGHIQIDGVLDEPAWDAATPVTDFVRFKPSPGEAPPGTTDVRFLQDENTLYVGVKVRGAEYGVRARIGPRERINADDQIGLYIDTFADGQTGYIFYTNPLGIQQDIRFNTGEWQRSWNTVYSTKGRRVEDGFDIEMAFPFRSLKYPRVEEEQDWGVMITRKIPTYGSKYSFPLLQINHPRFFSQTAPLRGVRPPSQGSGVEVVPGVVARVEGQRETAEDPMLWESALSHSMDLRVGVTPNLGLAATINPDFSEIEADVTPVVLNQRFAFWYPERRRFFTDGAGFFMDQEESLYSRSIVQPLEGIKVVGREGPWSIGVLQAIDKAPTGTVNENGTPGFGDEDLEGAWASNAIIRLRHDLLQNGYIGVTLADKRLLEAPSFQHPDSEVTPPASSFDSMGVDTEIPLGEKWTLAAAHAQSLVHSRDEMLWGTSNQLWLERPTGEGLGWLWKVMDRTMGYRKELGFDPQSGFTATELELDWSFNQDGRVTLLRPQLVVTGMAERQGEYFGSVLIGQTLVVDRIHEMWLEVAIDQRREGVPSDLCVEEEGLELWCDDVGFVPEWSDVTGWSVSSGYEGHIGSAFEAEVEATAARVMDFTTYQRAHSWEALAELTFRPSTNLRMDTTVRHAQFFPLDGTLQNDSLIRSKLQWQLTRELGIRWIEELSLVTDSEPELLSSVLVTWMFHPFTAAYIGYAESTVFGEHQGALERSVFAKVHVLLRP